MSGVSGPTARSQRHVWCSAVTPIGPCPHPLDAFADALSAGSATASSAITCSACSPLPIRSTPQTDGPPECCIEGSGRVDGVAGGELCLQDHGNDCRASLLVGQARLIRSLDQVPPPPARIRMASPLPTARHARSVGQATLDRLDVAHPLRPGGSHVAAFAERAHHVSFALCK